MESLLRDMIETKTEPWAHQSQAYRKLGDAPFGALLMEMGLGKSKTAIDLAYHHYRQGRIERVLLICPSPLKSQWAEQQIPDHHPGKYRAVIWESSKSQSKRAIAERKSKLWDDPEGLKWLIVNVEAFSQDTYMDHFRSYTSHRPTMIIVDEATRIKNPSANRTQNIRRVAHYAVNRLILTGSLITGSPYDAWAPFEFLRDGFWGMSYYAFRSRYGIEATADNPFGGKYQRTLKVGELRKIRAQAKKYDRARVAAFNGISERDIHYIIDHPELNAPYKHLAELKTAIDSVSVQVRKEDALDIPPKIHTKIDIEMSPDQKKIYKDLKESLMAEHRGEELTVANKLALITRLQQVAGGFFPHNDSALAPTSIGSTSTKIAALVGELEDIPGSSVVIWARFVAEIKAIGSALEKKLPGRTVAVYYGGVPQAERAGIVQEFQAGNIDTLIANPATAGFGLNLQVSHTAFYYSQDFSLENRLQSEDRIHRAGQSEGCIYVDLVSKGTVDEGIREALRRKTSLADYFASHSLDEFIGR